MSGSGVLIYNAGGAINFSGNSKVQLSAATTGAYAGIVLYQPLGNTQTISLGNSSVQTLQGVVYASGRWSRYPGPTSSRKPAWWRTRFSFKAAV